MEEAPRSLLTLPYLIQKHLFRFLELKEATRLSLTAQEYYYRIIPLCTEQFTLNAKALPRLRGCELFENITTLIIKSPDIKHYLPLFK